MLIGHQKQWEFLKKKFELNQLSHAYLFVGQEGIGKKLFAKEFSEFLGCKFPDLKIVTKKEDKVSAITDIIIKWIESKESANAACKALKIAIKGIVFTPDKNDITDILGMANIYYKYLTND